LNASFFRFSSVSFLRMRVVSSNMHEEGGGRIDIKVDEPSGAQHCGNSEGIFVFMVFLRLPQIP